jgi:hypothetical protein
MWSGVKTAATVGPSGINHGTGLRILHGLKEIAQRRAAQSQSSAVGTRQKSRRFHRLVMEDMVAIVGVKTAADQCCG